MTLINSLFRRFFCGWLLPLGVLTCTTLSGQAGLAGELRTLAQDPMLRGSSWGACVVDISSDKVLFQYSDEQMLIPASALKTVTTATALGILGPDFRFQTELAIDGPIKDGVLQGNIYLIGRGDPTLGSPDFAAALPLERILEKFRLALQQKGIRKITGRIIGDGTYYPTAVQPESWSWNDLGNYYGAGIWGLNFHDNLYFLRFQRTTRIGDRPSIIQTEPGGTGLEFLNEVVQDGPRTGDNAYIFGGPYTALRYVRGTIPAGSSPFTIKGSLPDPPLFAAVKLQEDLRRIGVLCEGGATTLLALQQQKAAPTSARTTLLVHASPTLREIVTQTNHKSVNLYAEGLLRAISRQQNGDGSLTSGRETLQRFWQDRGLRAENQCFLEDGSGLSPRNVISARYLASLLAKAARDEKIAGPLRQSLPLAGRTGPLAGKFKGTAAEGHLWAKSGTLDRVRSYAGYADTASGKRVAFAFIINNYSGDGSAIRQKLDRLMQKLCEE
ncbi:MAG: D-alanyl-D-alanine carboxypeptidase/D-alanyl-D-alanine-endopeptidase [Lewinellaceae bacterium]|nr:D-alanyl-D-alanine carboxypeptidase/D-alanyl-D-alanine-endopeptidase [Lewinellaceae bacterium]